MAVIRSKLGVAPAPADITIHGTKDPNQGKTILAIYELADDTLRICYDLAGQARPTAFLTTAGTQQFLVNYKKSRNDDLISSHTA